MALVTPTAPGRLRCLVVDDHAEVLGAVAAILAPALTVQTAGDGATAIEAIVRDPPDVLLLDLKLPDMHGLRVLDAVRGLRPELPVIVITGYSSEPAAIAAANLAVSGYLLKPFSVGGLRQTVAMALALRLGRRLTVPGAQTGLERATAQAEIALLRDDSSPPGPMVARPSTQPPLRPQLTVTPARWGRSVQRVLIDRRLERAKALLADTDEQVRAIAARLGFHDAAHFCR